MTTDAFEVVRGSWESVAGFDLSVAFDQAATAMAFVSLDGRWAKVNPALCDLLGRPAVGLVGRSFQELTHPDDLSAGSRFMVPALGPAAEGPLGAPRSGHGGGAIRIRKRYLRPDGSIVHAEVVTTLLHDPLGRPVGYFSQTVDLTAQHALQQQIRHERDRLRATLDNSPMPMAELDLSGNVVYWNAAAEAAFGWTSDEVAGSPLPTVVDEGDRSALATMLAQVSAGRSAGPAEFARLRRDGSALRLSVTCGPIRGQDGSVEGVVMAGVDVTEQRRMEERLQAQAFCDPLTGLPNRPRFLEILSEAICKGSSFGLAILDVTGLKAINDTIGERAGDQVLVEVSRRLLEAARPTGIVGRLGGDDFAVLLGGVEPGQAVGAALELVSHLQRPFELGGRPRRLAALAGVTSFHGQNGAGKGAGDDCACPPGLSPLRRAKELLREADMAMGEAKIDRGSAVESFKPAMREELNERVELVDQLRHALDQGQLTVAYQPIFRLSDRRCVATESLVRWQHPERGAIPPDRFIPLAEKAGLVGQLDRWVMEQACASAAGWPQASPAGSVLVHVNVSGSELMHPLFIRQVLDTLLRSGLDPSRLVIELTESVLVAGADVATERLRQLKSIGVKLSIDDFGTGYSSLSYLEALPVDEIKLDRSFVADIHRAGPRRHGLLRSIVQLAQVLDLEVVAEGIELQEELDVLAGFGCALGQGWLVSPAVPAGDFAAMLEACG
ncbi:MAG: EAL domain-containing protein [Actinomycetota bacterium]|nr:EAL domain-containing protein [Actinomycetota bacterium]